MQHGAVPFWPTSESSQHVHSGLLPQSLPQAFDQSLSFNSVTPHGAVPFNEWTPIGELPTLPPLESLSQAPPSFDGTSLLPPLLPLSLGPPSLSGVGSMYVKTAFFKIPFTVLDCLFYFRCILSASLRLGILYMKQYRYSHPGCRRLLTFTSNKLFKFFFLFFLMATLSLSLRLPNFPSQIRQAGGFRRLFFVLLSSYC